MAESVLLYMFVLLVVVMVVEEGGGSFVFLKGVGVSLQIIILIYILRFV